MNASARDTTASRVPLTDTPCPENEGIAGVLEEVGDLLAMQEAQPYRAQAYRRGAAAVRALAVPVTALVAERGIEGLTELPHIGAGLARAIAELVGTGRLRKLDWLRGHADSEDLFATVPGIGPALAHRVHEQLGVHNLEELEQAAHDGRLARLTGFGERRVQAVRDSLARRLGRPHLRRVSSADPLPIGELLDVDREYRRRATAGSLHLVTPRRFNPGQRAWLPILHTERGPRHYTALFSNTARAHALGKTRDWVVIYAEDDGADRQATVVTERRGPLEGRRVVRGRERETQAYYRTHTDPETKRARTAARALHGEHKRDLRLQTEGGSSPL